MCIILDLVKARQKVKELEAQVGTLQQTIFDLQEDKLLLNQEIKKLRLERNYPDATRELPSSRDIISSIDATKLAESLGIPVKNFTVAEVANSNSLDPLLDIGHSGLLIGFSEKKPFRYEDLAVGDIIVYQIFETKLVVHRLIEIGLDSEGRFYRTRGDNTGRADPYILRDNNLKYLLVGIIY